VYADGGRLGLNYTVRGQGRFARLKVSMTAKRSPALDRSTSRSWPRCSADGRQSIQKLSGNRGALAACLPRARATARSLRHYHRVSGAERCRPALQAVNIFARASWKSRRGKASWRSGLPTSKDVVECWEVSGDSRLSRAFGLRRPSAYEALTARLIGDPKLGVARIVSHGRAGDPAASGGAARRKGEQS